MRKKLALALGLALEPFMIASQGWSQPVDALTANYYDVGGFHCKVTTDSAVAQTWFDRGLAMCFGFNHEEASRCFEQALASDPGMPMALWGWAYASGPNTNNMQTESHAIVQAALAVRLAKLGAGRVTERERALIEALAHRYAAPAPDDREPLNRTYADAMRQVYHKHTDDPTVTTLFAESLINLQPWKHWTAGGEPAPATNEIVAVLEKGLARWPHHAGICHLYIHVMEMSPTPEQALLAANRLLNAMPGVGHLVHMPSHIDVLMGDYQSVIETNKKAIAVDAEYVRRQGRQNFYTLYRIHNYHFLVYGAMFDGQSELALKAARELVTEIPVEMLRSQTDFLDAFMPTALHVLVRFGRWDAILAEPEPADYLPVSRSIWRYARGLAFAATGRVAEAKEERQAFERVRATVPETSVLFQNTSRDILGVAEAMLEGEIAYREGAFEVAFERLREAVRRDDALNYDEPWGWMQPARHALGALLLEQDQLVECEKVYRADLQRHPKNPWALHGLAECLVKRGKYEESAGYATQFAEATKRSDVEIDRSCFCRLAPGKRAFMIPTQPANELPKR